MSYCIFITESSIADEAINMLEEQGCRCVFGDENDPLETIREKLHSSQADGLIVRKATITKDVLMASDKLKAICKHGVGVEKIDIDTATRMKIPVMITPFANQGSVAEHTLALILVLLKQIILQDRKVRAGIWDKKDYQGVDLAGKTVGMIGYGRIARCLDEILVPFAVKRIVYDPLIEFEKSDDDRLAFVQELSHLLRAADIVSIHCPLTPETRGMLNQNSFRIMKKTAYLINTARGAIINEIDLIAALENKQIAGAALDTLELEPPDINNSLIKMENVIITGHIGGVTVEAFRRMGIEAAENILFVLQGKPIAPSCLINPVILEPTKIA